MSGTTPSLPGLVAGAPVGIGRATALAWADEIAVATVFVAAGKATSVTGQSIPVDGGVTA